MNEIWKAIQDFEGFYEVSNLGAVRRVKRGRCEHCGNPGNEEKILKGSTNPVNAYVAVSVSKPGMGRKTKTFMVHRLVAEHFVEGRTKDRNCVNHVDGNKRNNRSDNLQWVWYGENNRHAWRTGLVDRDKTIRHLDRIRALRWPRDRKRGSRRSARRPASP